MTLIGLDRTVPVPPPASALRWFPATLLACAALSYASIALTRVADGTAILWLPNAAVAALLYAHPDLPRRWILAGAGAGIALGNVLAGFPVATSALFGAINLVAVVVFLESAERFLQGRAPHDRLSDYLSFAGLVCLPSAFVGAVLGATAIAYLDGAPFATVLVGWAIGDLTSLMTLFPIALTLKRDPSEAAHRLGATILGLGVIAVMVAIKLIALPLADRVYAYFLIAPVITVLALYLPVAGVAGASLLVLLGVHATVLGVDQSQLSHGPEGFLLVFICLVFPANLIASRMQQIRRSEAAALALGELKSDFLATMSHEIRTPLNAIHGMFELLQLGRHGAKADRYAATGLVACGNLQRLLDDILEMARIEARMLPVDAADTPVAPLVDEWEVNLEAEIARSGKTLSVEVHRDFAPSQGLRTDPLRLRQIVANLLNNAVKFTDTGKVTLAVSLVDEAREPHLCVDVTDDGPGISAADQARIFDRFQQVKGGATIGHAGTGLGLAISHELAQLLGGTLSVHSATGGGSCFRLSVPLDSNVAP